MKPILVLYATREGQTRKIAEHVAATLRSRQLPVDVIDAARLPAAFNLVSFDAAVLAASIHGGKHEPEMRRFVKEHREELERMPSVFLSVSLTEATAEDPSSSPEKQVAAARMVGETIQRFLSETGWSPTHVRPVAGALLYRRYGVLLRLVMRFIARGNGGPTDTSRDYEFTDWKALDRFADELAAEVRAATLASRTVA